MNDPTSLGNFIGRLEELERRVAILEHDHTAPVPSITIAPNELLPKALPPAASREEGFLSTTGKALLGIAGAYLLRATAEGQLVSGAVLAPFAILYGLAWLVFALRSKRTVGRITYACTSVLILAPMLWELTMRFQVLPAWADAASLFAMVAFAFALSRSQSEVAVLRITSIAAATLGLALAVVTHRNLPFLLLLLLILAMCEFTPVGRKMGATRAFVALAADLGVWLLIYIYRAPHSDYPDLSAAALILPGFLLFAIAASETAATIIRRTRISAFEILQSAITLLLACCGILYFGLSGGEVLVGVICLMLTGALYAALFSTAHAPIQDRNRAVLSIWSAALFLIGSLLCIPSHWRAEWLGTSSVAVALVNARTNLLFLAIHANVFLVGAALVSGLFVYAGQVLTESPSQMPSFTVCFVLLCAMVCHLASHTTPYHARAVSYISATLCVLVSLLLVAHGFIALLAWHTEPALHHMALLRSLAFCLVALALSLGGAAWERRELIHLAYAVVVAEGLKLLLQDLRNGHLIYMSASICLFALTLIALPRIAKKTAVLS